ncbi:MAG: CmcI family methyltransferase [Halioglobus sp.]|nr:CmcI family methyltransferase [Halioglobus sp.]
MNDDLYWLVDSHRGKTLDKWQSYLRCYETLFSPLRDEQIALLELGVQNGGSLEIWSQFFPHADVIVGCDSNPLCAELSFDDPRIKVVVGNSAAASTLASITEVTPEYDVIIDDAAHTSDNIIANFANFFPLVRKGGVYVVEDLHCSYWSDYGGGLYTHHSAISFFKALIYLLNQEHVEAGDQRGLDRFRRKIEHYGIHAPEGLADCVVSLEFRNSMAVIRKGEEGERLLGTV